MFSKKFAGETRVSLYLGILLVAMTASMLLLFYLNAPFVERNADTPGYLDALYQLQATGNPVNAFRLPIYPLFLLLVYLIAGQGNLMAVSILQGFLFLCATGEIYLLALLITRKKWLAFFIGLLVGTSFTLISYIKPIMTEGLSLWLLTTIMLCTVTFLQTFRPRFFWIGSVCLLCLLFTRPEWIFLPCLLSFFIITESRKQPGARMIFWRTLCVTAILYVFIGGYIIANTLINHVASLSTVSNMNLIGKVLQYHMQNETPYNPTLSHIYDSFVRHGNSSPYEIFAQVPALRAQGGQASVDWARAIILHHPVEFLSKSVPFFFTSLYHYYPVSTLEHPGPGPYDMLVSFILKINQSLYITNIALPFCALFWLILCCYRKTRRVFYVRAMGLLAAALVYAVLVTTLGGYFEDDYMRVHIVFDPLITLMVWGSAGSGISWLISWGRKKRQVLPGAA